MMTTLHPLAEAYLARLRSATASLPRDRAADLLADIEEHVRAALPPGATDEDARRALDALGTPEQLVGAAAGDLPADAAPTRPSSTRDWIAVALYIGWIAALVVAPPLGALAWIAFLVLLLSSHRWSVTDKVLAWLAPCSRSAS